MKAAFTLLETLAVFAVLAVLVAVAIPTTARISQYSARMKSVSNMRQIGVAARLYANDHNQQLPGHTADGLFAASDANAAWPQLFCEYLSPSDPQVFLDPSDRQTSKLPLAQVLSGLANNTGYVYNGFDDLASDNQPLPMVPLTRLETPSQVVLLAQKVQGAQGFYVDLLSQPLENLLSLVNPSVYDGGAHYLFADGSVRFIKQADYTNNFWLADKSIQLPTLPPLPPLPPLPGSSSNARLASN